MSVTLCMKIFLCMGPPSTKVVVFPLANMLRFVIPYSTTAIGAGSKVTHVTVISSGVATTKIVPDNFFQMNVILGQGTIVICGNYYFIIIIHNYS